MSAMSKKPLGRGSGLIEYAYGTPCVRRMPGSANPGSATEKPPIISVVAEYQVLDLSGVVRDNEDGQLRAIRSRGFGPSHSSQMGERFVT